VGHSHLEAILAWAIFSFEAFEGAEPDWQPVSYEAPPTPFAPWTRAGRARPELRTRSGLCRGVQIKAEAEMSRFVLVLLFGKFTASVRYL